MQSASTVIVIAGRTKCPLLMAVFIFFPPIFLSAYISPRRGQNLWGVRKFAVNIFSGHIFQGSTIFNFKSFGGQQFSGRKHFERLKSLGVNIIVGSTIFGGYIFWLLGTIQCSGIDLGKTLV